MANKRTDVTDELLASVREAVEIVAGRRAPARVHLPADAVDVRAIRRKLGLSQPVFAARFGFALASVRDWEQGRRQPTLAAQSLLRVIAYDADTVWRALKNPGGSKALAQKGRPPAIGTTGRSGDRPLRRI